MLSATTCALTLLQCMYHTGLVARVDFGGLGQGDSSAAIGRWAVVIPIHAWSSGTHSHSQVPTKATMSHARFTTLSVLAISFNSGRLSLHHISKGMMRWIAAVLL